MQEDPGFAREALRLGASGYVLKDAAAEELLLALRTVMRGSTYLHPALGAQMAVLDASTSPLTDREIQVLRLIAEGHTNSEVARRLYLSLRTVEAHRGQLRTKLGVHTRAELSAYAREHGLIHDDRGLPAAACGRAPEKCGLSCCRAAPARQTLVAWRSASVSASTGTRQSPTGSDDRTGDPVEGGQAMTARSWSSQDPQEGARDDRRR